MGRVLVVDDEPGVRFTLSEALRDRGHQVDARASAAEALEAADDAEVVISDLSMPGMDGLGLLAELKSRRPQLPVVLLTARGSERAAVQAMKSGAFDYLTKPFDVDELGLAVERALELAGLRESARRLQTERSLDTPIVGRSAAFERARRAVEQVAPRAVTVLLSGETGTGKELFAGLLHAESGRRGPLVRFNCAAIPAALAEAELFGHTRGAFTGASSARVGYFAAADGGTLVLDEVGELPPELQAKLLRAIELREITPLGATRGHKVDVRLCACTHRDLKGMVERGEFRDDLYYRLAVVEIRIPSLAERRDDIPQLVELFRQRYALRFGLESAQLSAELVAALERRAWPGNVRELENCVQRLLALSSQSEIGLPALEGMESAAAAAATVSSLPQRMAEYERRALEEALGACQGNQSEAARRLGISRVTLIDKLKRHGLHPTQKR